jgi:hypothetical protein
MLVVLTACRIERAPSHRDSSRSVARPASAAAPAAVTPQGNASLDSSGFSPGYGLPHPGSWTPVKRYADSSFTIDYPASAAVKPRQPSEEGRREVAISELPACRWPCFVNVTMWRDSAGKGLSGQVRELMTADTTGGNADAADYLPTLLDSLPVGGVPAAHLEMYCGDCTSHAIFTVSRGWIAEVEYSLDDRDGNDPALLAKLESVARSFRWREP